MANLIETYRLKESTGVLVFGSIFRTLDALASAYSPLKKLIGKHFVLSLYAAAVTSERSASAVSEIFRASASLSHSRLELLNALLDKSASNKQLILAVKGSERELVKKLFRASDGLTQLLLVEILWRLIIPQCKTENERIAATAIAFQVIPIVHVRTLLIHAFLDIGRSQSMTLDPKQKLSSADTSATMLRRFENAIRIFIIKFNTLRPQFSPTRSQLVYSFETKSLTFKYASKNASEDDSRGKVGNTRIGSSNSPQIACNTPVWVDIGQTKITMRLPDEEAGESNFHFAIALPLMCITSQVCEGNSLRIDFSFTSGENASSFGACSELVSQPLLPPALTGFSRFQQKLVLTVTLSNDDSTKMHTILETQRTALAENEGRVSRASSAASLHSSTLSTSVLTNPILRKNNNSDHSARKPQRASVGSSLPLKTHPFRPQSLSGPVSSSPPAQIDHYDYDDAEMPPYVPDPPPQEKKSPAQYKSTPAPSKGILQRFSGEKNPSTPTKENEKTGLVSKATISSPAEEEGTKKTRKSPSPSTASTSSHMPPSHHQVISTATLNQNLIEETPTTSREPGKPGEKITPPNSKKSSSKPVSSEGKKGKLQQKKNEKNDFLPISRGKKDEKEVASKEGHKQKSSEKVAKLNSPSASSDTPVPSPTAKKSSPMASHVEISSSGTLGVSSTGTIDDTRAAEAVSKQRSIPSPRSPTGHLYSPNSSNQSPPSSKKGDSSAPLSSLSPLFGSPPYVKIPLVSDISLPTPSPYSVPKVPQKPTTLSELPKNVQTNPSAVVGEAKSRPKPNIRKPPSSESIEESSASQINPKKRRVEDRTSNMDESIDEEAPVTKKMSPIKNSRKPSPNDSPTHKISLQDTQNSVSTQNSLERVMDERFAGREKCWVAKMSFGEEDDRRPQPKQIENDEDEDDLLMAALETRISQQRIVRERQRKEITKKKLSLLPSASLASISDDTPMKGNCRNLRAGPGAPEPRPPPSALETPTSPLFNRLNISSSSTTSPDHNSLAKILFSPSESSTAASTPTTSRGGASRGGSSGNSTNAPPSPMDNVQLPTLMQRLVLLIDEDREDRLKFVEQKRIELQQSFDKELASLRSTTAQAHLLLDSMLNSVSNVSHRISNSAGISLDEFTDMTSHYHSLLSTLVQATASRLSQL